MVIEPTGIDGLSLLRWNPAHDLRGSFARLFCSAEAEAAGLPFEVVQTNLSENHSARTLRGMHYQRAPHAEAKIVFCLTGRMWDVAVDMREDSPTHLKWRGFELAAGQPTAVHIAAGLAHGYLTLEPDTKVLYLIQGRYVPEAATGFRWDDPAIDIRWPVFPDVISPRDCSFPLLDPVPGADRNPSAPEKGGQR